MFTKKEDFFAKDFLSKLDYDGYNLLKINKNYAIHKDLILLLPTSGTTGSQKFVKFQKLILTLTLKVYVKLRNLIQMTFV